MRNEFSESLAREVAGGTYKPTDLNACDIKLTLDRCPQVLRFSQFILFSQEITPQQPELRYLTIPRHFIPGLKENELKKQIRKEVAIPLFNRWNQPLKAVGMPEAGPAANVADIREFIRAATISIGNVSNWADSIRMKELMNRLGIDARRLPSPDASDDVLLDEYTEWYNGERARYFGNRLKVFNSRAGNKSAYDREAVLDEIVTAFVAPAFQEFDALSPQVAVCALFEQMWEHLGYTRGELIGSLGLAPGEKVTLELHTWDKSTRKSEEELSSELEMRTSEKITQRDSLTVAQEYSRERNTSVSAGGTIPIPQMPITANAKSTTNTKKSLKRTRESLKESVIDASQTLKINRKSRIEVSREVGREEKQVRVIENMNRCHTLNCYYFEIVSNYKVTTRLAEATSCILIKNPRLVFTREWILCHEHILRQSILNPIFLAGFEAAHKLETEEFVEELNREQKLAALSAMDLKAAPYLRRIKNSYRVIQQAVDLMKAKDWDTRITVERAVIWVSLLEAERAALDEFVAGDDSAENLKRLLDVIGTAAILGTEASREERLKKLLELFPYLKLYPYGAFVDTFLGWDVSTLNDAGLRAAIESAWKFVQSIPRDLPSGEQPAPNREIAEARVEFSRLKCHLKENWMHYSQAVWLREDANVRFERLLDLGPIATFIENEVLGFHGEQAAYPLRKEYAELIKVGEGDEVATLQEIVDQVEDENEDDQNTALIAVPTPGALLEAMVGECDACEDYIRQSRIWDLKSDEAKARNQLAEAERREQRLSSTPPDLSDPSPPPANQILVKVEKEENES